MRKVFKILFIVLSLFFFFSSSRVLASFVSTFDAGDEGWRFANDVKLLWQSSGGNPGGFLQGNDKGYGKVWYYVSPSSWSGDWSQYINGTLSFDLKLINTGGGQHFEADEVIIYGNNDKKLIWNGQHPTKEWTHYNITLNEATFNVTEDYFMDVISNVKELWIRGEYTDNLDIEGLDNVIIKPVPIPSSIWLLGSVLIGMVLERQQKRSKYFYSSR